MLVPLYKVNEVPFHLHGTDGFHVKAKDEGIERLSMTFTGNGKRQDEIFFFAKTRRNLIF